MDKVAGLSASDRRDLFSASAEAKGIPPAIIEKDFWVCWLLKYLFTSPQLGRHLVFKGGTSLSKVFGLIARFSEDIDLVLNWELLGYGVEGMDPWASQPSKTRQGKFNQEFNRRAEAYIADTLQPHLVTLLSSCPEVHTDIPPGDGQVVNIHYPAAFALSALRPEVKLEIGPLASWVPSDRFSIQPYAAETHARVFDEPACEVTAILAERTFWEKATILHQQAHRSTIMPAGYSRHYYDLFRLAGSEVKARALADPGLLKDVVTFKQRFYPSAWARYDEATPGAFRLMPNEDRRRELEKDYVQMQEMIFEDPPVWSHILDGLAHLEAEINELADPGAGLNLR